MGGGVVIAVLWLASPDVDRLREQANDDLLKGQFDKARRELEQVLELMPRDAPAQRDAARAASAAGQFDYAVAALERAHHFEHHTRDPEVHYLRGEALYVLGRDEEARREHHIAELEIGKTPTARMEKLWLARIYARRGYVVLADRLYESMQPPPPATDAEVSLNQADAHLINEDWAGGARGAEALPRARAQERARPRDARRGRWRRAATSKASWRCGAACPTICRRPRTIATTGGRSNAPESFRGGARPVQARARAGGPTPTATLAISYQRMRFRTTPEVAGGASLRSDPQAWAWRVQAGASLPFGVRHSVAAYAWHDAFVRLEREPGRRAERAREARHRHRSRRADWCWPAIGGVAAGRAPTRATTTAAGTDASGAELLTRQRRLSVRRPGGRRRRSVVVHAREPARGRQRAVERSADHRARRRDAVGRDRAPVPVSQEPRRAVRHRRAGAAAADRRGGDAREADGEPVPGLGRDRLQPVGHADAGGSRRGARRDGWSAAST